MADPPLDLRCFYLDNLLTIFTSHTKPQEQRPIPAIKDHEVLLEMDSVGICGSDVHYLVKGRIGNFIVEQPMIIGHEASGVVHKVGRDVKHLKVGDRVAIEPGVPCRLCDHCKQGRYNLCADVIFCATPPVNGNLTKYYAHAGDFCFKLPDHVTMEEGALLEPLSVGVHACKRGSVKLGTDVLIFGAGPIGLATLAAALSMGANTVAVVDIVENKLALAKELGATHTIVLNRDSTEQEKVKKIHALLGGAPDVCIDCSGAEATVRLSILTAKSGGCVVLVGMGAAELTLPITDGLIREVDIRGVFRYCNDYPAALALVSSGKINVKKFITHHFDITETQKAFDYARNGLEGAVKIVIHCTPRNKNNPVPL